MQIFADGDCGCLARHAGGSSHPLSLFGAALSRSDAAQRRSIFSRCGSLCRFIYLAGQVCRCQKGKGHPDTKGATASWVTPCKRTGCRIAYRTFEQTAIETVEPLETANAYSPGEAQPRPVLAAFDAPMTSWEDGVGQFLETRCAFCHGGTLPLSQLNLTTYDQTLLGGTSMPAVVPNNPDNSGIIIELRDQEHAVAVADEDLAKLTAWIAAGAPQQ
jgi:hypothetical protein